MTLADHYTAFKARLDGGILAGKVHDGVRPKTALPVRDNYAVIKPKTPKRDDNRYTGLNSVASKSLFRFDVRYVGTSLASVLQWQQAAQERLIPDGGIRLVVTGRKCDPIRLVDPVEEGDYSYDKTTELFYVDDTFEFISRRAA
ncbi:hypothetical protein [Microbacterium sp. LWH12-1.2]|uniref:hypothetical protein n=1 Tax=Microbacterium sp. LWH12-1.2 TaxID=3135259 RepID=UPI0034312971